MNNLSKVTLLAAIVLAPTIILLVSCLFGKGPLLVDADSVEQADKTLPDFAAFDDVKAKKSAFFDYFYPIIVAENKRVLKERQTLLNQGRQSSAVKRLCEKYANDCDSVSKAEKQQLLKQVDMIPPALALAQAAKESGWGTSRFARKGNNYFGQWCFSKGCGLVPSSRLSGASHEVRTFSSPRESVRGYLFNLNTVSVYKDLREIRHQARKQDKQFTGRQLAEGLLHYSERREAYVEEIKSLMSYNELSRYDDRFWQSLPESH